MTHEPHQPATEPPNETPSPSPTNNETPTTQHGAPPADTLQSEEHRVFDHAPQKKADPPQLLTKADDDLTTVDEKIAVAPEIPAADAPRTTVDAPLTDTDETKIDAALVDERPPQLRPPNWEEGDAQPDAPHGTDETAAPPPQIDEPIPQPRLRPPDLDTDATEAAGQPLGKRHFIPQIFLILLAAAVAAVSHVRFDLRTVSLDSLRALVEYPEHWRPALLFVGGIAAIIFIREFTRLAVTRNLGVQQQFPIVFPAPWFGALISVAPLRSAPKYRGQLVGLGLLPAVAGAAVSVALLIWSLPRCVPIDPSALGAIGHIEFGAPLLLRFLEERFSTNGNDIVFHPLALAGWVGLLITSLDLFPAWQFAGGHLAHALTPRRRRQLTTLTMTLLFGWGMFVVLRGQLGKPQWGGLFWLLWALVLFIVGPGKLRVREPQRAPGAGHYLAGLFAVALFVLSFSPIPLRWVPPLAQQTESFEAPPASAPAGTPSVPEEQPEPPAPKEEFEL